MILESLLISTEYPLPEMMVSLWFHCKLKNYWEKLKGGPSSFTTSDFDLLAVQQCRRLAVNRFAKCGKLLRPQAPLNNVVHFGLN
jgi:hypothetical protein